MKRWLKDTWFLFLCSMELHRWAHTTLNCLGKEERQCIVCKKRQMRDSQHSKWKSDVIEKEHKHFLTAAGNKVTFYNIDDDDEEYDD